jgi:hypothetical protein
VLCPKACQERFLILEIIAGAGEKVADLAYPALDSGTDAEASPPE